MLFYHVISFSFRLYLHAFIIIPPLIIRKSREVTIENKPPRGFTPPSWASEKRKMDEKLSGQLRRLNPERSKSRKPMAAINSSQKSLPCVQESKLIRTRNQLLSFPLLSFFFFFFPLSKERFSRIHYPLQKRTRTSYLSPWYKTRGMRKRRYIHIYTKEWDLVFGKEEGYLTDEIQGGGGDCQEIGPF